MEPNSALQLSSEAAKVYLLSSAKIRELDARVHHLRILPLLGGIQTETGIFEL